MQEELLQIERRLWTNDAEFYGATLLPDAILIFSDVGKIGTSAAVEAIREENARGRHWAEVAFEEAATMIISPDAALLTYKATARWNYEETPSSTLCATLYVRRDRLWRVAFHQQSPIAG
jgi:hypothetical protein